MAVTDPRTHFYEPVLDAEGNALMNPDPQATVYLRGTNTKATLYAYPDGATIKSNPFNALEGWLDAWLEPGAYDIVITDTAVPPRRGQRVVGYDSAPAADAGHPSSWIMPDAALSDNALSPTTKRQDIPIGGIIMWYRPLATVPVPTGFVVCDGSLVASGTHDLPGVGSFNTPDMRNAVPVGADQAKAVAAPSVLGAGQANAPGIGGVGGSMAAKNIAHTHGIPDHTHSGTSGNNSISLDHLHTGSGVTGTENQSLSHSHGPGNGGYYIMSPNFGFSTAVGSGSVKGVAVQTGAGDFYFWGGTGAGGPAAHNHSYSFTTSAADRSLTHTHAVTLGSGATAASNPNTVNTTWTSDPGTDFRPAHVGLLFIMKVKRS